MDFILYDIVKRTFVMNKSWAVTSFVFFPPRSHSFHTTWKSEQGLLLSPHGKS